MGDFNKANGSILVCLDFESPSYGVSVLLGVELGLAAYAVLVNSFVVRTVLIFLFLVLHLTMQNIAFRYICMPPK